MRDMVALRCMAIASNLAFIAYGVLADLGPVLVLHLLLLPVNVLRLAGRRESTSTPSARRPAIGHEHRRQAAPRRGVTHATCRRRIMQEASTKYVLGSSDHEIERLDQQSTSIEAATRFLLRAAGISSGMRVLDLGTGVGHVAMLVADLVGPQGCVVGIDTSARLLDVAVARASTRPQLHFVEGDVRSWRDTEPFDAIVGRLILFHLADP